MIRFEECLTYTLDVLGVQRLFIHSCHLPHEFHRRVSSKKSSKSGSGFTIFFFGIIYIPFLSFEVLISIFHKDTIIGLGLDIMVCVGSFTASRLSNLDNLTFLDRLREWVAALYSCLMGHPYFALFVEDSRWLSAIDQ